MISQKGFGGGEESRLGHTELEEPVELSGKKKCHLSARIFVKNPGER